MVCRVLKALRVLGFRGAPWAPELIKKLWSRVLIMSPRHDIRYLHC